VVTFIKYSYLYSLEDNNFSISLTFSKQCVSCCFSHTIAGGGGGSLLVAGVLPLYTSSFIRLKKIYCVINHLSIFCILGEAVVVIVGTHQQLLLVALVIQHGLLCTAWLNQAVTDRYQQVRTVRVYSGTILRNTWYRSATWAEACLYLYLYASV
jgi:hypothetical protein